MNRFGSTTEENIKAAVLNTVPKNTIKTKASIWKQFMQFCSERNYNLDGNTPVAEIARILEDWAYNMKKRDGTDYKEYVIKTIWNTTAKCIQEKYFSEFGAIFDPFKDIIFQSARSAKNAKRRELQSKPDKRKTSATALTKEEIIKMMNLWDENTPNGLQKKFFHIAAFELAWRGGEAAQCKIHYFKTEKNNDGTSTGRLEYNSIFSKTAQGGDKKLNDSKWLTENKENPDLCPVRLFYKILSKRGPNILTDRLFLTVNQYYEKEGSKGWYKNMPIGPNELSKWTRDSAIKIGLNAENKFTNHSNRASTVSTLAKAGVSDLQITKITGHSNGKSLKSYLQLDPDHHSKVITNLRNNNLNSVQSATNKIIYNNCTFSNCTFSDK